MTKKTNCICASMPILSGKPQTCPACMQEKWDYHNKVLVPKYEEKGEDVPPHLEPDFFEGWN